MNLINKKLLQQKIHSFEFPNSEKVAEAKKLLEGWQKALKDSDLEKTKEKSVQGKFLSTFFESILGYTDVTTGNEEWTLIQHPRIENDSKEPDGSLGWFTKDKKTTRAVIELKDAKTQLDKKQNRGSEKLTPIEQAYLYATKYEGCNWIIVSNFKEIRIYNKNRTQEYYEKFDVIDLIQENELKRFYYLLSKENLISKERESIIDNLAKDTTETEQDITKKFYAEYRQVRLNLLDHLFNNNSGFSKEILLEKAQKLLDRFIFTLFCEDTSTLLPLNIVKNTYERAINSLSPSDERVWSEFKGLFLAIDKGNKRVTPPINAYNGGLFAFDEVLDNLSIKDEFWSSLMSLAEYDFDTDLNVNILGHIFEQSISDLEIIKENINLKLEQGGFLLTESGNRIVLGTVNKSVEKKGRRKKDGIFYTPEYITHYIVENTVGKYLEEHPDKLETLKILDPACGSGAFLNQAHSYLVKEYTNRYEAQINEKLKTGKSISLFDYNPAENNRNILLNNLYGVDLNQESVEITKLALWLKTARSTEPLQNLDKNIKCGNSLIDDSVIAGEKAFNWNTEFKDIVDEGGFDVIVGNPPYVFGREKFTEQEKDFYNNNYTTAEYQLNTFILFIEKSLNLLKDKGYLSFIIPNSILKLSSISKLRKEILQKSKVCKIVNLVGYSFENVNVETVIIILQKTAQTDSVEVLDVTSQLDISKNEYRIIDGSNWFKNNNSDFDIFLSNDDIEILNKIKSLSNNLEANYFVSTGLKAYQSGKGNPKQTAVDVLKRPYDFDTKIDEYTYKYLDGKSIGRYEIIGFSYWLKYGKHLAEPRKFEVFSNPRVLVREITTHFPRSFSAVYTEDIYLNNLSIINILSLDNDKLKLKYLLAILNSRLASYIFIKTNPKANRSMFPKVILEDLRNFPIANSTETKQKLLADMVEKMLELKGILREKIHNALELLEAKFQLNKLPNSFESFYKLGLNGFLAELEKHKIKLNLSQQEDIQSWFKSKKDELQRLENEINSLDNQIDQEVYKLYGLTGEEIKIIEDSVKLNIN